MMQMKCGSGCRVLSCRVACAPHMEVVDRTESALHPDTVGYAVCRFLCRNAALFRVMVRESYDLRFAKGRRRRIRRQWVVPAVLMELPGSWVQFRCTVTADGVTVESVRLLNGYPGAR